MWRVIAALVVVAACSPAPTTKPVANTSPSPAAAASASAAPAPAAAFAVVAAGGAMNILDSHGQVLVTTSFTMPSGQFETGMPWVSVTSSRVYFLDRGKTLRFIGLDASLGTVRDLALDTATQQAGIAVSPDGLRIAVAILSYRPAPGGNGFPTYLGMRMYVEDTSDGANHVDIFSSTTAVEFPVTWDQGHLIIAVAAKPNCCGVQGINPYSAVAYHVADPSTGRRLAALCVGSLGPEGPPEPVGTLCDETSGPPKYEWWDGREVPLPAPVPSVGPYLLAMSPDGAGVAVGGTPIRILRAGGQSDIVLNAAGTVLGWLDAGHIVYADATSSNLEVVSAANDATYPLPAGISTLYFGPIPAAFS